MVVPKIVNTFALNLNKITMNDLNRLKVVLVEQKKTVLCGLDSRH